MVCADSALVVAQVITHGSISLEDYLKQDYGRGAPGQTAELRAVLRLLPGWQF